VCARCIVLYISLFFCQNILICNPLLSFPPHILTVFREYFQSNLLTYELLTTAFHSLILNHLPPSLCPSTRRCLFCAEAINSSAPDTGNMEIIGRFGTDEQRETYLLPLLQGVTRSCFGKMSILIVLFCPAVSLLAVDCNAPIPLCISELWATE
jgi:hypothetical protein